jgi:hypothetical protein
VYRPGGGKQFGGKAFRGGKQLVRPPRLVHVSIVGVLFMVW